MLHDEERLILTLTARYRDYEVSSLILNSWLRWIPNA